jgi:hypothetical protein
VLFVVCLAVQFAGYQWILVSGLRNREATERRRALKRWLLFVLVWQGLVIVGCVAYAVVMTPARRSGFVWVTPPLGALLGTALPYQLVAMRLARAGRE